MVSICASLKFCCLVELYFSSAMSIWTRLHFLGKELYSVNMIKVVSDKVEIDVEKEKILSPSLIFVIFSTIFISLE